MTGCNSKVWYHLITYRAIDKHCHDVSSVRGVRGCIYVGWDKGGHLPVEQWIYKRGCMYVGWDKGGHLPVEQWIYWAL